MKWACILGFKATHEMPTSRISESTRVLLQLLRQSRTLAGLTQVDMAGALSLKQSDVSKIERGVRKIDVMELRRWAVAVGVPFEEFARELDERWSQFERTHRYLAARRT